ncbi:MAG: hypothetical protein WA005_05275 [Candidatus Binataceae bacterium]
MASINGPREVRIRAFNPYAHDPANRHLITRDTLQLIKRFRAAGYKVVVEPEERGQPDYVFRKGVVEFLQQPLVLLLVGIPVQVVAAMITEWILAELRGGTRPPETNIVLERTEEGTTLHFNHRGEKIDDAQFRRVMNLFDKVSETESVPSQPVSPSPEFPLPLYLEHTNKIIGRCRLVPADGGRTLVDAEVFDPETKRRMDAKDLKGFSIAGVVKQSTCSICGGSYRECDHLTGKIYNGEECTNRIEKSELTDVSVVKEPINPEAVIWDPQKSGSKKKTGH